MAIVNPYKAYKILGSRVDQVTRQQMIERLIALAQDKQQKPISLIKQYVELVERGVREPAIRKLLNDSTFAIPEGVSMQWAAAFLYGGKRTWWRALWLSVGIMVRPSVVQQPLREKFAGTVFTLELLERCASERVSVYLIGTPKGGSITQTADFLKKRIPNLTISGTWEGKLAGYSGAKLENLLSKQAVEAELVADLQRTQPDIIFVAMGFPLQEKIIAKILPQLKHGILIGEGGTFDYDEFGGQNPKAPHWVQRVGLEWLWRLFIEPSRWKRQLAIPRFAWQVYRRRNKA